MELINLLINPRKCDACFLCFKESLDTMSTSIKLEIKNKFLDDVISLADMTKYLFPSLELTLTQACKTCTDLLIKMYITIHQSNIMRKFITAIINTFNKNISTGNLSSLKECSININLSKTFDSCVQKTVDKSIINITNIYENQNDLFEGKELSTSNQDDLSEDKQCLHCLKVFDNIKCYRTHIRNHRQRRKKVYHTCHYCEYRTVCKQSLEGHINKKHLRIRPFVCNVCYKNFYHKKNLVEHQISHNQLRNEICHVCGESFIHKKNLLEHLKLHSGEKPYSCGICDKTFVTSGRRLEHVKRNHNEKKECCLLCDKKFSLTKELTRHMKTVHS